LAHFQLLASLLENQPNDSSEYENRIIEALKLLNQHVNQIYLALPENALFIVASVKGDATKALKQSRLYKENSLSGTWTEENDQLLQAEILKARSALVFLSIKTTETLQNA